MVAARGTELVSVPLDDAVAELKTVPVSRWEEASTLLRPRSDRTMGTKVTLAKEISAILTFQVDGLLFDNDGVLVDSHDAAGAAWNRWARTWAPAFDFHRDIQHGRRLAEIVADWVPEDRVDAATRNLMDLEMRFATDVPAISGAAELLRAIPESAWAVVTSGVRDMALARMASAGLPRPATMVSAEDVRSGKPAPDPYLAGASALQLAPAACAVFEDAPTGIAAARAAGVKVVVGVGPAAVGEDVDVNVAALTGITFDGRALVIPDRAAGANASGDALSGAFPPFNGQISQAGQTEFGVHH